jgi:hypothetical protein
MRELLTVLPDTLLDFLDKVRCTEVQVCRKIADTIWQKRRYVSQNVASMGSNILTLPREIVSVVSELSREAGLDGGFRGKLKPLITVLVPSVRVELSKMTCAHLIDLFPFFWWFVGSLQRVFLMQNTTQGPMSDIAAELGRSMLRHQTYYSLEMNEYGQPMTHCASFSVDWDPRSFLAMQHYTGSPEEIIDHVIALSGTRKDAEATGCAQYMQQTWPPCGGYVLALLRKLIESADGEGPTGSMEFRERDTEAIVSGSINGSSLTVNVRGLRESIIRVGQQLCWLGAALRPSPRDDRIAYCAPIVSEAEEIRGQSSFRIKFGMRLESRERQVLNGECWQKLFKNLVVAEGFPIRRRLLHHTGLEVPLNVLGRLVPTRWVTRFDGKVYIKGHSTVLVPTRVMGNTVVWHLICDDHGQYISYIDSRIEAIPGLYPANLDLNLGLFRHIVGWCPAAKTLTGMTTSRYRSP